MRNLIFFLPIVIIEIAVFCYVLYLVIKALKKYIASGEVKEENRKSVKSLGEILREKRVEKNMTQEFVAEQLGVSRQAVSKWESGKTDPSTSNLLSLCKLYGIEANKLLASIEQ